MNQFITGSMCLTTLIEKAREGHSAFTKSSKDGKIYFNYAEWINEEPNDFGQHSSIQLNSVKELRDKEGKIYIGNGKKQDTTQPIKSNDVPTVETFDNIPVREVKKEHYSNVSGAVDDLPF